MISRIHPLSLLAATAYLQVLAVVANTYFIGRDLPLAVLITTFAVQWLWTSNVRKVALATTIARLIYCTAATAGGMTGYFLSHYIAS